MSDNKNWNLIGKRSPQLPQMFYPISDSELTLTKGDIVAARCTMVSNEYPFNLIDFFLESLFNSLYYTAWFKRVLYSIKL